MKMALFSVVTIVAIVAIFLTLGFLLPSERSAKRTVLIKASQETVFAKVTEVSNQAWRSQIGGIEVIDATPGREVWIEKPKNGPPIKFRTRVKTHPSRFEIEIIDNPRFGGYWVGAFSATTNGETAVEFSEHVVDGLIAKLMSYAFFSVDKSVDRYIKDLQRALE
jgi:hypothetical protein